MKRIEISISSMVKAIIIIAIGLLLVMQTPTFATTGKSTGDTVRVREKPSTESEVIELLGVGDTVEILGQEGDWYKVNFKGTIGYVSQSFISTNDNNGNGNNTQTSNEQNNEPKNNEENNSDENSEVTENSEPATNTETNATAQTTTVSKIYKMSEDSKVRILPIITAEEIGEAKKDESVSLVINAGLWAYIKSDNVSGWIRIDKLSTEEVTVSTSQENENKEDDNKEEEKTENNTTPEENKQSQTIAIEPKKLYVNSAAINVRSEANTTSEVVDSIGLNTEVTAVGEENGWYKVQVNGETGYIRKDLLSSEKTEVTSRSNELDRASAQNAQANAQQAQAAEPVTTASSESVPVSASGVSGNDIAAYAQQFLGCSYVYGASGPNSFDCSGLTMYVCQHFGYSLSHSSKVQATQGVPVSGELQPGDILVFSNDGYQVGHVGIYLGNDKFIHASDPSTGVIISNLHDRWNINKYWGARRIIQ